MTILCMYNSFFLFDLLVGGKRLIITKITLLPIKSWVLIGKIFVADWSWRRLDSRPTSTRPWQRHSPGVSARQSSTRWVPQTLLYCRHYEMIDISLWHKKLIGKLSSICTGKCYCSLLMVILSTCLTYRTGLPVQLSHYSCLSTPKDKSYINAFSEKYLTPEVSNFIFVLQKYIFL